MKLSRCPSCGFHTGTLVQSTCGRIRRRGHLICRRRACGWRGPVRVTRTGLKAVRGPA